MLDSEEAKMIVYSLSFETFGVKGSGCPCPCLSVSVHDPALDFAATYVILLLLLPLGGDCLYCENPECAIMGSMNHC